MTSWEFTAWLTACTVSVAGDGTIEGAVYWPLTESIKPNALSPPITPFTFYVADWLALPATVALNCYFTVTCKLLGGVTLTEFWSAWPLLGLTIKGETSTASKLEPAILFRTCRSSLLQRESGAPEMYQDDPLSASIMPYCLSAVKMI